MFCSTTFHLSIHSHPVESDARKVCGRLSKLPVRKREGDIRERAKDMTGHDWGVYYSPWKKIEAKLLKKLPRLNIH